MAKSVEVVVSLPEDLQRFVEEHGAEQPKFSEWACEVCGAEYVVNWVWCEIRLKPQAGEGESGL